MKRLIINTPHVVHEIFSDDEAAIINLKTGNYYSLNPTGAEIWSFIETNAGDEQIAEAFCRQYQDEKIAVSKSVKTFIDELMDEDLVVEGDSDDNDQVVELDRGKNSGQFIEPVMERFADMQDLLLLDPIHDVDETGFPHKKAT